MKSLNKTYFFVAYVGDKTYRSLPVRAKNIDEANRQALSFGENKAKRYHKKLCGTKVLEWKH